MSSYPNPWQYQGRPFDSEDIGEHIGFVYLIEGPTKSYVGKKIFLNKKKKVRKNKRAKRILVESDWKSYWGSSKALQADITVVGIEEFHREILYLCKTKGDMSYLESREIILRDALLSDDYYNDYLMCRISGKHLTLHPESLR